MEMENTSEQENIFEQIFLQSTVSTQILDKDGWCKKINPKLSELFGVKPEDIEGKVYNIFQDKALEEAGILPELSTVFHQGKKIEWEILFDIGLASEAQNIKVAEKKKVWFHNWAFPLFNAQGEVSHVIIQHADISAKKAEEMTLAESEKRMRGYFNTPLYGIAITSPGKNWVEVNDALCIMLGYTREEILQMTWVEMTYPDDIVPDVARFSRLMSGEINTYILEKRFIRKDKEIVWANLSVEGIRNTEGKLDYVIAILQDITEKKKEDARLSEQNEEIQKMNNFMLHREEKMIALKEEITALKTRLAELEEKK